MSCLFPIFLECREWTLDPYWQDIFEQCANGKFPKDMRITKDGSIIVTPNGKNKEIISTNGDSLDIFQVMMNTFKTKLGLMSDRDIKKQKDDLQLLKEKLKEGYSGTWKQIKPKKIKNNIILNFVIEKQKEYDMTQAQANKLLSTIKLGFIFKSITSDDIDYEDGVIYGINGIDFTNDGNFTFTLLSDNIDRLDKNLVETNKIHQTVERYVRDYKSQCIKV